jgi:hypothetical protein
VILDVLGGLAVADALAAVVFAATIYLIGRRSGNDVTIGRAVGLAILIGLPAAALYFAVRLILSLT